MGKNEELDRLFQEWRQFYDDNGIDSKRFCPDGIIDESRFEQAKHQVLFVLRETNKFPGGDLRKFLKEELKWEIWRTTARWAYGILNDFRPGDTNQMHDALCHVAVMNQKKITGGSRIQRGEIMTAVKRDKDFIAREVAIIDPQIIVTCGAGDGPNVALALNLGSLPPMDQHHVSLHELYGRMRLFLWIRHPSQDAARDKTYEKLKQSWNSVGGLQALDQ